MPEFGSRLRRLLPQAAKGVSDGDRGYRRTLHDRRNRLRRAVGACQRRLRASRRSLAALERSRAEAASAARAAGEDIARLRETLDAVPMPVWRRDRDGSLVDCNLAYAASLGAAREEVLAEARELMPVRQRGSASAPACMLRGRPGHAGTGPCRDRRAAPAARTHRGAVRRRRDNRLCPRLHRCRSRAGRAVAPHQRACRRARKHLRRGRHLWPRQKADILQPRLRQLVGDRGGVARRASPRSTKSSSGCAKLAAFRNSPISAPSSASDARCSPR